MLPLLQVYDLLPFGLNLFPEISVNFCGNNSFYLQFMVTYRRFPKTEFTQIRGECFKLLAILNTPLKSKPRFHDIGFMTTIICMASWLYITSWKLYSLKQSFQAVWGYIKVIIIFDFVTSVISVCSTNHQSLLISGMGI